MKCCVAVLALLLASPALAQQQPASAEQRVGAQIGALMIQNASQAAQIEQLQALLAVAQARVKSLEDKYEPKAPPK